MVDGTAAVSILIERIACCGEQRIAVLIA